HLGASGGLAEAPLERGGGRLGAEGCREGVMRGEDDGCKAKREGEEFLLHGAPSGRSRVAVMLPPGCENPVKRARAVAAGASGGSIGAKTRPPGFLRCGKKLLPKVPPLWSLTQ